MGKSLVIKENSNRKDAKAQSLGRGIHPQISQISQSKSVSTRLRRSWAARRE
jgi:hypothetical protein